MKYWLILGLAVAVVAGVGLWGRAQYEAGRLAERAAAVERANQAIIEMEKANAQISDMALRAKCAEFGHGFDGVLDRCTD